MTQRRIYQDEFPYFVTFRTQEGLPVFDKTEYAELLSKVIFKTSSMKKYNVLSYQIMPDHLHLLTYNQIRAHPAVGALHTKNTSPGVNLKSNAGTAVRARKIYNISELIHGIKSYYCDQIRDRYDINFPIFQPSFHTRIVGDYKYLGTVMNYIKQNPIKENLPPKYHRSPYQYLNWDKINSLF